MKTYTVGTPVFCDFAFSGKPRGKCVEVVEEGDGRSATKGRIRVKLTESVRAYIKGEIIEVNACTAVPTAQETGGGIFRRVNTDYRWVKPANQWENEGPAQ